MKRLIFVLLSHDAYSSIILTKKYSINAPCVTSLKSDGHRKEFQRGQSFVTDYRVRLWVLVDCLFELGDG